MKKIIFSVLMLGVMLMVVGSVSAVSFTTPITDEYILGDNYLLEWDNGGESGLWLKYNEDDTCVSTTGWVELDGPMSNTVTEHPWDTTELDDGKYCLRLEGTTTTDVSFYIDNTVPVVSFAVTGDLVVFETVTFDGTATDGGSGIDTYLWDFGDGNTDNVVDTTHEYNEPGNYDVVLTVTDVAGNVGTYTEEVVIEDIEVETETFEYETGILGIVPTLLDEEFDTGLATVTCTLVPSSDTIVGITISNTGTNCEIDGGTTIPYDERGVHELVVRATDGTTILYYDVTITVYSWWIDLEEDWNLISIPMMPEDTSIDSVLGGIQGSIVNDGDYTIFQYDATSGSSGKWYKAKPTSSWTGTLDDIVPGYGYWVKMNAEDTLKGFGDMTPSIGGSMLGIEVANGWNLIGHYGLDKLRIRDALSSLRIGGYLNSNTYYDTVVTSDPGYMNEYEGYWMTAKFLPDGETLYTPSQDALDYVL